MEFEVLDLTISCRLCLVPIVDNAIDLYAEQLMVQLESVFQMPFQKTEWFPRSICSECQTLVTKIYDFVQKVRSNQDYLQSLNLSEEEEPELNSTGSLVIEECLGDEIIDETTLAEDNTVEITSDNGNGQHLKPTDGNESESDENSISDVLHSESLVIEDCSEDDTKDKPILAEENTVEIIPDKENDQQQQNEPLDRNHFENSEICNSDEITETNPPEKTNLKKNQSIQNNCSEDDLIRRYYEFRCDICLTKATTFKALLAHFREKHQICGYVKCCNKKLYRRCRLLEHISKHLDPDTFRCGICKKVYSCRTSLELHNMHMHLSDSDKPHTCPVCSKSFAKDYQLKSHKVRHIAVECPECGRILSSRLTLREHLIKIHSPDQKSFVCDICGKEFRSKLSFDRHILLHQDKSPDNRIQCHLCPRWLVNKIGLQKHVRTQHIEAGDIFVCGDCGKTAPNSTALQQHKRVVHSELKFACETCGKKFKRAISLKEHRATHTGESLYSCRFCPTTFISNANMYTHQKKMHPYEWQKRKAIIKEKTGAD